ncbi:MAG TPA: hypothetical protein VHI98_01675 [Vicinamibacterales bacterium]|jgi:hypothetical protein|nr:hypothetical protein [Vicinamibacterales bacterium]
MTRLEQTLARVRRNGAIGGGALLALSVLLAVVTGAGAEQFLRSYLIGFMFWVGVALGSLAILMLHHLTGGAWGLVVRRHLEAASRTMPFLTLAFLPIAIGVRALYIWARPEVMAADPILQEKQLYLNVPFFLARAVIYFAVWNLLVYVINRWSLEQDAGGRQPVGSERKFRQLSAPGLMAYGLTITFASVDWVMSLDPHWFSTIFGVLFMGAQALSAMAFAIVALAATSRYEPLEEIVEPSHFHDLGKLLFAFVMLWAYFSFSQFLIIWSGNLPEEIPWYVERLLGGWGTVALVVSIGSFVLPFLLLLSRDIKRNPVAIGTIAGLVLVVRVVDLIWMIAPRPGHHGFPIHWLDVTLPLALGGLWLALFARELTRRRLLAVNDPYFEEVFAHGHH